MLNLRVEISHHVHLWVKWGTKHIHVEQLCTLWLNETDYFLKQWAAVSLGEAIIGDETRFCD
jgi:hypothetical protein